MNDSHDVEAVVQTGESRWLVCRNPARVIEAWTLDGVAAALAEVERLTRDSGYYAVGYLAFEAGGAFGMPARPTGAEPDRLVWFAFFEPAHVSETDTLDPGGSYTLGALTPSLGREAFAGAFARIKTHLADGDSYQVNFTFRLRGSFAGDPKGLFANLVAAQGGRHGAFLRTGTSTICSASPELFFALDGLDVSTRPMKGTARRGRTLVEDDDRRRALAESTKERAENVMIVDMMRNDLGRIADVGTVETRDMFAVERYPNVWQMTSLVTARSRASLEDVFAALHPPASVSGAPKVRTVELLNGLEPDARGVYTGAIGCVRPDGNAHFSVAIRTAVVDAAARSVEFGVGSGIVWDSDADAEYDECLLKGSVLGQRALAFELLETTVWTPSEGFLLLDRHMARQRDSATYFGFVFSEAAVRQSLADAVTDASEPLRVRCLVSKEGAVRVEHSPLVTGTGMPVRLALARTAIDAEDPFLFHKTTRREVYARAREARGVGANEGGTGGAVDDVVLWNPLGEITEATTANIVVELADGSVVTPPVASGLLAGTFRASLVEAGTVGERIVSVADLKSARRISVTNSVHGRREAVLVDVEAKQ